VGINENIIKPKADDFALRIVKLYKHLVKNKRERVLSNQILRSGTSIGANITEAQYGISRAEFRAKMSIALKEAAETEYWLTLLCKSEYLTEKEFDSLQADLSPIIKLLISIVKNTDTSN
jgi:four helix bundle protein